jgi:hypothetical protein
MQSFLIVLGYAIAGFALIGGISAPKRHSILGVLEIPTDVQQWADDGTPVREVWELCVALGRVRQVRTSADYWTYKYFDAEPAETAEDVVRPALRGQWPIELTRLDEIAARVGFIASEAVRTAPESFGSAQS